MTAAEPIDAGHWFDAVIGAARTAFPDADYLRPGGVLSMSVDLRGVDTVRIELPPGQFLHFQSLDVTATGIADAAAVSRFTASSWYGQYREQFDLRRLLDFDHPRGTSVHTKADDPAWAELRFDRPVDITRIRLRNVGTPTAGRATGLKVAVSGPGGPLAVIYDAAARRAQLEHLLIARIVHDPKASADRIPLAGVVAATVFGEYPAARTAFEALTGLPDDVQRAYRKSVSRTLLDDRQMEWTIHGPQRCFGFWSREEKLRYLDDAVRLCRDLRELTPNVCFGFGAALAAVRDGDMIPHDDDLDVIIGLEPHEASTFPIAHNLLENFLRAKGYRVSGTFMAHRHVSREGRKHLDLFVGIFEGDVISWYPSARGLLERSIMYPTSEGTLLGVPVPLPRNPLIYLERVYGANWRNPDPGFRHAWDRSSYEDLARATASV